ncbi:MAG: AmmeMemoRadiSam system protein B, partial [Blastocatellia bacterium]|nr:AmmeMemoRadiSam system protein B [Blastocatellia bacterium]
DSPIRRAKHAGVSYPADSKTLEQKLDSFFVEGAGIPNFTAKADSPKVKAIISPHMDLRCAGSCYSWAYKELAEKSPEIDTIVILGTSHYGCTNLFSVTDKNFETPLGTV